MGTGYQGDIVAFNTATETKTTVLTGIFDYGMLDPDIGSFASTSDKFYIMRSEDSIAAELWCTDGTEAGTVLLKEFNRDGVSSSQILNNDLMVALPPVAPEIVSSTVVFLGEDEDYGVELWRSDGTPESTNRITDLEDGAGDIDVDEMIVHEDKVFFTASTSAEGLEMWYTQGTVETTFMLGPMVPGAGSGYIEKLTSTDNGLYFAALFSEVPYRLVGNSIEALPSINGGGAVEDAADFTAVGDKIVFTGATNTLGNELFVYDPETNVTSNLADINVGTGSSAVHTMKVTDNNLLFFAATDGTGMSLWLTDGTPEIVTKFLANHDGIDEDRSYKSGSSGFHSHVMGNSLLFIAYKDNEEKPRLWSTSGLINTASLLSDTPIQLDAFDEYSQTNNTPFYFSGEDPDKGFEPWVSDGTPEGTRLLLDLEERTSSIQRYSTFHFVSDTSYYYVAYAPDTNWGLYKTDGTTAEPVFVKSISDSHQSVEESFVGQLENIHFFTVTTQAHGRELWRSDGTAEGTYMLKDIFEGTEDGVQNTAGAAFDGHFYFSARSSENVGSELWHTDGTETGTVMVKDINVGADSSSPDNLIVTAQNQLIFRARSQDFGDELWVTDGTAPGTTLLQDIYAGASSSSPRELIRLNDVILFRASNGQTGRELWRYDGTTVEVVEDLNPGGSSGYERPLALYGDYLFFEGKNADSGFELWKSNGTENTLVADLEPGGESSSMDIIGTTGQYLIFGFNPRNRPRALVTKYE